ncbi:MAG: hypothetical protein A3I03_08855 [Candidatus Rokubacteria bacterium RIFCSPLOWO2_02_FULL_68_19]|nr:MAG: hypothetical protein A3I03_08855 [Candidatus Rokubacteria bacterium RIFCSPLOWO2_02_FULL_68_19]
MAASATSHRMPPWSVPTGLACRSAASNSTTAWPGSTAVGLKPMSAATGGGGSSPRIDIRMRSSILGIGGSLLSGSA